MNAIDPAPLTGTHARLRAGGLVLLLFASPLDADGQLVRLNSAASATANPIAVMAEWPGALNPASLAGLSGVAAAVHAARPYHLPSLHLARVEIGVAGRLGVLAAAAQRLGYEQYGETTAALHLAGSRGVSRLARMALGVRIAFVRAAPRGYPSEAATVADVGWVATIDSVLSVGASLEGAASMGRHASAHAPVLSAGLAVRLGPTARLSAQVHREEGFPPSLGIGAQLRPQRRFFVRAGLTTEPVQLCGGFGLIVSRMRVDLALVSHQVLGMSSSVTLSFRSE